LCTACRRDFFFSYRKEGGTTGRLMAVIGIIGSRPSSIKSGRIGA
jgi:copper oxidase (laccase) domain-containing protein